MANTNWLKKPAYEQVQEFVANASLGIDIGDLMYLATDDARPASSQADAGSEALNQQVFANNFIGVAVSARDSTDTAAGVVRVQCDGLYEFTCTSSTFEIGDLVGADEAANGTELEDQSVKKVTDASTAIGVVVQRYSAATTKVWCRLINRVSWDIAHRIGGAEDFTTIQFVGATGANEIQVPTNLADALSVEDTAGDLIVIDTTTGTQVITITPALTVTGVLTSNGGITMGDAQNIIVNATTGTKIGTATTQKLGFWNATPVVQPASADQADQGAMTTTGTNTGTAGAGLTLIGATNGSDVSADIMNDFRALQEDITALDTLLTAIRTALVDSGIMKGAA